MLPFGVALLSLFLQTQDLYGPDQTVFEGDTVQLDGSGSFDPQGDQYIGDNQQAPF